MRLTNSSSLRNLLACGVVLVWSMSAAAFSSGGELAASCRDFSLAGSPSGKSLDHECGNYLFNWFTAYARVEEERQRIYLEGGSYSEPVGRCFRITGEISYREVAGMVADAVDVDQSLADKTPDEALRAALAAKFPCPAIPEGDAAPVQLPVPEQ